MTRRNKQTVAVVGGLIVAVLIGVGAWVAISPGSYDRSHDGCITVNVPSSTGGGLIHQCGAAARATCRSAFARHDKIALLTRPQCRLADLAEQSKPAASADPGSG
jgi:hypothetical protein